MVPIDKSCEYHYFITDHLGNVRSVFHKGSDGTAELLEERHYYPFGLEMPGMGYVKQGPENKYRFNGKEMQDENNLTMLDFGARMYDPQVGRWWNIDPHAENYLDWTSYNFVGNNPLNLNDPTGMDWNGPTTQGYNWEGRPEGNGTPEDPFQIEEVEVVAKSPGFFEKMVAAIVKFVKSLEGDSQPGGEVYTMENADPENTTTTTAEHIYNFTNVDDLLPACKGIKAGQFKNSILFKAQIPSKLIGNPVKIYQTLSGGTSVDSQGKMVNNSTNEQVKLSEINNNKSDSVDKKIYSGSTVDGFDSLMIRMKPGDNFGRDVTNEFWGK